MIFGSEQVERLMSMILFIKKKLIAVTLFLIYLICNEQEEKDCCIKK